MNLSDLAGQRIAVLGLGLHNRVLTEWLVRHGLAPVLADAKEVPLAEPLRLLDTRFGADYLKGLDEFDVVFRAPGLPYLTPELQAAVAAGVVVTSATKLFFELSPAMIVGVSGTKGKGTTGRLIQVMLQPGKRAYFGGNNETPPMAFLDDLVADDVVVLELSSFNLQDLEQSPPVAVITNLGLDHLDHHRDAAEYYAAKEPLLKYQQEGDVAVLNADDPGSKRFRTVGSGARRFFSSRDAVNGAYVADGQVVINRHNTAESVVPVDHIKIPGPHNLQNVLAAVTAADVLGVPIADMATAIKAYQGMPHHLEAIATRAGILYINDSYATNVQATVPALESFTQPIVWIAGGHDKGLDYAALPAAAKGRVKAVVLMGPAGKRIGQALTSAGLDLPTAQVTEKEDILPAARRFAMAGDVVLLSPAAASFDMFGNVAARGDYFAEQVKAG